ncbi:MAG: putative transposase [Polaribacter sp.]|jgi:putative transposase
MPSTYSQILYQIVFATYLRQYTMDKETRGRLFAYLAKILENKRCHVYQINGVEDHIHIVVYLHPSVSLASLVKDIKLSASQFIKKENLFKGWKGWQNGYAAFTYSQDAKMNLVNYVKRQEKHHSASYEKRETYREELIRLLKEHNIPFKEEYLD